MDDDERATARFQFGDIVDICTALDTSGLNV